MAVFASQVRAFSGSPRQSLPSPVETTAPSTAIVIDIPRFDLVKCASRGSEYEETTGGVVGDGVAERDVPVGDAGVDDLEAATT